MVGIDAFTRSTNFSIIKKETIFDQESTPIVLNDWFPTRIEYAGQGRAEFLDPHGAMEGCSRVQINEDGTSSIEVAFERDDS